MTRGKHGAAAAVRHEVQTAAQQIETYKQAVARLTAENRELRAAVDSNRVASARRERELLARLEMGASPKVEALQLVVQSRTRERDEARTMLRQKRDQGQEMAARIHSVLREEGVSAKAIAKIGAKIFGANEPGPEELKTAKMLHAYDSGYRAGAFG